MPKKWFAPVIVFRVFLGYKNEPIEKEELMKMEEGNLEISSPFAHVLS